MKLRFPAYLFTTLLLGNALPVVAQGWVRIATQGIDDSLARVYFTSPDTGYIVGRFVNGSGIMRTVNNGQGWDTTLWDTTGQIEWDLHFPTRSVGYGIGRNLGGLETHIRKTTNAGTTWAASTYLGRAGRYVFFDNADTGYVTADSGYVMKTVNGGTSWTGHQLPSMPLGRSLSRIHCPLPGTCFTYFIGWLATDSVFKTTDGWENWTKSSRQIGIDAKAIFFPSVDTGYLAGTQATTWHIRKTIDGGVSWAGTYTSPASPNSSPRYLRDIHCINSFTCYAVGISRVSFNGPHNLVYTTDGGINWTLGQLGIAGVDGGALHSIHFPSDSAGYIIGTDGIWKFDPTVVPIRQSVEPAFDRPMISGGKLRYSITNQSSMRILIFDLRGRQRLRLFDGPQGAGTHEIALPAATGPQILDLRVGEEEAKRVLIR